MISDKLVVAQPLIENYFLHDEVRNIFKQKDLSDILAYNGDEWDLPRAVKITDFLEFLVLNNYLKKAELNFPFRKETRYIKNDVSIYKALLSLRSNAYFSHHTAMYFNDLTEQLPKTIYLNVEQTEKPRSSGNLEQSAIDTAFKRQMRLSTNFTEYEGLKIYMLNGKQTGNLGVIEIKVPSGEYLVVTNAERTLIDIVVRPVYAGGIYEVLNAYKKAEGKISLNKITAYLRKMNYVYPYHQAVGFLLETAGLYDYTSLEPLRQFGMEYDFYLTYNMKETDYSKEWKLFYPKGFK